MTASEFTNEDAAFRERMDAEDINGAWAVLAPLLLRSDQITDAALLGRLFADFAEVGEQRYGESFAILARACAEAPTDVKALYRLGHRLQEKNLPSLSAALLRRAHALAPEQAPVLTELVSALERQGLYRQARAALEAAPPDVSARFLPSYLLAFNAIMAGDTDRARALLPTLSQPSGSEEAFLGARIAAMLARADALQARLPTAVGSGRGDHYVWYGSLLLCASTGSPECRPSWGRGAYAEIAGALFRLEAAFAAWKNAPEAVFSLPDPASRGLAGAAAQRWGVPCSDWLGGAPVRGLIVAYDLKNVIHELRDLLRPKSAGQTLFVYAASASSEQPVCPDVLGDRYWEHAPAWQSDAETDIFDSPEDDAPDAGQITQDILAAMSGGESPADPAFASMVAFLRDVQTPEAMPLVRQETGRREPLWVYPQG